MNPDEIRAWIAARQELRRRGKLNPAQDAALTEMERRYPGPAVNSAMAAGDTATARVVAEGVESRVPVERPAGFGGGQFGGDGAGRTWEPTPHAAGREFAEERGPIGAFSQGVGSFAFGVGTPVAAADEMLRSRIRGEPRSWEESMEFARGLQEGSAETRPVAYGAGAVTGLVGSGSLIRRGVQQLPKVAQSVFNLQEGQTVRNLMRMSAAGGTSAGVTAAVRGDDVSEAATAGAVLGPVVGGAVGAGVRLGRYAASKINPDNAAIRILSKRLGESADAIAARYNDFVRVMGRRPRLVEIMRRQTAEEMGQVASSKVGVGASTVFREAEEAAALARPGELRTQVERGGRSTTLPAEQAGLAPITEATRRVASTGRATNLAEQQAELAPITEETRRLVGSRVRSTETAQLTRRDAVMDRVMNRIGNHRVPLTDDMREVIEDPDVQQVLPPALRRRIHNALEQGETIGSIDLSVRTWEMMRQALAGKSGAGTGQVYSRLRDKIRDYVGERVPEYSTALREFGRRTASASATTAGRKALQQDAREFADMIRSNSPRTDVRVSEQVGARVGARSALANQLGGTPQDAERFMARLARDNRLRANLRQMLSRNELSELEALGERYGHRLNIIEGVKIGQKVLTTNSRRFADALREVSTRPGGAVGARASVRNELINQLSGTPEQASSIMERLARDSRLRANLRAALTPSEADALEALGDQYGYRLNIIEGVKVGQRVVPASDPENFADAVRLAGTKHGGEIGVREGARSALAGKAGESPGSAAGVATALAEHPGLQQRVAAALGGREAGRLQRVGELTTRATRNLEAATPGATEAQLRRQAQAQEVQELITGGVALSGRASGALISNWINNIQQRMRMSEKVAKRLAEMAVDPNRAHIFIAQMRKAGVTADELHRWYRDAAAATGITVGAN